MRLETVIIENFRSIHSIQLDDCGDFNVFIGKNNSGKSSILTAINSFFKCIQNGQLVSLEPPIGKEIDFFERETQIPIDINLGLSLLDTEKELLMQDIMTEAPQMKNAVNSIKDSVKLFVSLRTIMSPKNFCFVNEIFLGEKLDDFSNQIEGKITILKISNLPAKEIYIKQAKYNEKQEIADCLENNQDKKRKYTSSRIRRAWDISKESGDASFFISEILSDLAFSEIKSELEEIFEESLSYNDFWKSTKTISKKIREDATNELEESLDSSIDTFTGQASNIPKYVNNLLRKISELSILHLTERRKPIGQEEAKRLLSLKVKRGGEEDLHNIQETVLSLLGVKIDAFQGESSSFIGNDSAELDVDNFLVEANGSGIREALRLVLDVEFGKPQILLVEEPEIHLHPALETSMMRYLKRTSLNCQVFLTTHSTNFLDTAEMKNVYLISKPESTQAQKLNIQEAEEQIPKELGIRLSSLLMANK